MTTGSLGHFTGGAADVCHCLAGGFVVSLTLVGGANRKRSGVIPGRIQGEVLEVFDNNQVLISFGSYQGAAKGMTVFLDRLGPSYLWRVPFAELELVAVGSRHSVGQMKSRSPHTKIQVDDFAWVPSSRERALFAPLPELPRVPGAWERGGAIIDLTAPKKAI
jgi:hypothetical protein